MINEIKSVIEKHKDHIPVVATAELLAVIDEAEAKWKKVVAELELEKETANRTYVTFNDKVDLGRFFGVEKAIEIVRKGGAE